MDIRASLIKGLTADSKYLPLWYRYDKQGSIYNDKCVTDNKFYYFYQSEVSNITKNVQEIVSKVESPHVLVDMGCGNCQKSRSFIDVILRTQDRLTYIPVDISADFLKECSNALANDYGSKLDVQPIAGDYSVGIQRISSVAGRKLIIWLGGLQSQPYNLQVGRIESLAKVMSEEDRLVITLDVTQDAEAVEKAYLDPTGVSAPLYLNAIWRLNREYGSHIDTDKFVLEAKFEQNTDPDCLSRVVLHARAKCEQSYNIPGLGIKVSFSKGECLRLHEGEGVSCKYTEQQIRTLANRGGQKVESIWIDEQNHVALCILAKHMHRL